jgi:hypothetical protein
MPEALGSGAGFAMGASTKQGVALVSGSKSKIMLGALAMALVVVAPGIARAEGDVFIAGVEPDRRPADAPKLMVTVHPQAWYVRAVSGVVAPYPQSLFFLDNQGDWYTPFNRPGLLGPYDIRGWHKSK